MRAIRPSPVFAVYTYDERSGETIGTGYDMEESVYGPGLGVFSDSLERKLIFAKYINMNGYVNRQMILFCKSQSYKNNQESIL